MAVFALDKRKNPLMPTSEKRARLLLEKGRAVVIKMYPFTIRLKDRVDTVMSFVNKLQKILPVTTISMELEKKTDVLQSIKLQAKKTLKDAAAVNSIRLELANQLKTYGVPLELSSGGRTKFNRSRLSIPKTYALDAACVGEIDFLTNWNISTLEITCCGRGSYQRTRLDSQNDDYDYKVQSSVSEKIIRPSYKMEKTVH